MPYCDTCGIFVPGAEWPGHVQSYSHQVNEDNGRVVGRKSHSGAYSGEMQPPHMGPVCYKCGQSGHVSRNCGQGDSRSCFRCGQAGHIGRNCPLHNGGQAGAQRQIKLEPGAKQSAALPTNTAFIPPAIPHPQRATNPTPPEVIILDEKNIKNYTSTNKALETFSQCPRCTFYNPQNSKVCQLCDFHGLNKSHRVMTTSTSTSSRWVCKHCKDSNPSVSPHCVECRMPRNPLTMVGGRGGGARGRSMPTDVIDVDAPEYFDVDRDNADWDRDSPAYHSATIKIEQHHNRVVQRAATMAAGGQGTTSAVVKKEAEETRVKVEHDMNADDDICVFCQSNKATYCFMPCGHTVLCRKCATEADQRQTDRNCYICRAQFDRVAVGMTKTGGSGGGGGSSKAWVNAPSTFPWIGGELCTWDRFLREIKAAAYVQIQAELASQWTLHQLDIIPCDWSSVVGRFKEGWASLACPESTWAGVFAWHGAKSLSNTNAIAQHGWHTETRSRNNHAPGEYFGLHHSQCFEYARERHQSHKPHTLVYGFILRGKHLSWVENFCLVVDNPTGVDEADTTTYCLPIFTVRFPNAPYNKRWQIPQDRMPYRWQFSWASDENITPITYDWPINQRLNKLKTDHYSGALNSNDAANQEFDLGGTRYLIDVNHYTQTNKDTCFQREVDITCIGATPLPKTLWVSYNEAYPNPVYSATAAGGGGQPLKEEVWMVLDMFVQRDLTEGYFQYRPDELSKRQGIDPGDRAVKRMSHQFLDFVQFGKEQCFVDFESMKVYKGKVSQAKKGRGGIKALEGRMLAVVEA